MTFGWMQPRSVQKLLDIDGRLDASLGRPDGNKGSNFSELESTQNLLGTFEIAFLKLVTLQLVKRILFNL
jgi:hypothetical protein